MTDEEICKRVAEIEKVDYFDKMCAKNAILAFNPLKDWLIIGPLIVKHQIDLNYFVCPEKGPQWIAFAQKAKISAMSCKSEVKKAVCMAIIQKDKDNK
jgi:hypothetical protein